MRNRFPVILLVDGMTQCSLAHGGLVTLLLSVLGLKLRSRLPLRYTLGGKGRSYQQRKERLQPAWMGGTSGKHPTACRGESEEKKENKFGVMRST